MRIYEWGSPRTIRVRAKSKKDALSKIRLKAFILGVPNHNAISLKEIKEIGVE